MVAEGVEDAETLAILRDLGCDLVQGWHLGRPTSAADFMRLVKSSPARLDS
jgi:diguanylate cyclase